MAAKALPGRATIIRARVPWPVSLVHFLPTQMDEAGPFKNARRDERESGRVAIGPLWFFYFFFCFCVASFFFAVFVFFLLTASSPPSRRRGGETIDRAY